MKCLVFTFLQGSHKCFIRIDFFELISKAYSITFSWYVTNSILIYCLSFPYFLKFHLICWQNCVICPVIPHRQGFDHFPFLVSFNTFLFPVFFINWELYLKVWSYLVQDSLPVYQALSHNAASPLQPILCSLKPLFSLPQP